ncbi:LacI family DNA-binding transcriptional regulator [Ruania alba]|uniref:Transcriptional regulator, LacI family n=1 Tax=Ruania alba TaxID=648782 RepID=A0A1H5K9V6_9MICO|nr:LacI family DNA-binding transcriptional regulator [Ruania alba]SEE61585.1 transcriptional regulator, LacI family [Ruania alba]
MASAPTLRDVAAVAGVSVSTVSKVLNGRGKFAPETHLKIAQAVQRLGFRPDALARSFATGRSQLVGVLTEFAPGAFTSPVMVGASTYLGKHEMGVLFADAALNREAMGELAGSLRARRIDGLLVIGDGLHSRLGSVSAGLGVPVVYAFGESADPADVSFIPDNEMVGVVATEHLIERGRTKIAHIGVADDLAGAARARGCLRALAAAELDMVGGRVESNDWRRSGGIEATRRLLAADVAFDAIFCANDQIAFGALAALTAAGLRVPDDVALVGVDNWESMTGTGRQGRNVLTSVDPDLRGLGAAAAAHLIEAVDGAFEPGVHLHPCILRLGESTLGPDPDAEPDLPVPHGAVDQSGRR